ncbi:MAG: hypothetical protein IIT57_05660, partial [Treponema sp.]|nr:hypothetical protein [Treponema sp.]
TLDSETKKKMILCHYADNFASYDVKADGFAALAKRGIYYDFGFSEEPVKQEEEKVSDIAV